MRTLKWLYKTGVIVKRDKCSNHSLKPIIFTYTERMTCPAVNMLRSWLDLLLDGEPPEATDSM